MEKRILQNLLWMLVCLLALSCQKDDRIDGEAAVTEASLSGEVQRAKQWLEQWQAANRYGESPEMLVVTRQHSSATEGKTITKATPKWEQARVGRDNVVEVPIEQSSRVAYSINPNATEAELNAQLTRLLVLQDEQDEYFAVLMHIIGDAAYLQTCGYDISENRYKNMTGDFSGIIIYTYLDGSFCHGWRLENGTVTKRVTADLNRAVEPVEGKPTRSGISCTEYYYIEFMQYCTHTVTSGTVECSDWFVSDEYTWEECVDDGTSDGSGGGGGGIPGGGNSNNNTGDPCAHAQKMNNDQPSKTNIADLKKDISDVEHGYMVDKDGRVKRVTGTAERVDLIPDAGEKYKEIVHTHLAGDRCAISAGDIFQLYKVMYLGNHIESINDFRFTVLIDDHAFSLQITDENAFKRFANNYKLLFGHYRLEIEMARFFKNNGINIKKEKKNPTKTPGECTDTFIQFFNDTNSGLSVIKGAYDANDEPDWQAQDVRNGTVVPKCN